MAKATSGNFFEDFRVGMRLRHPVPRTIHGGDLALYIALTGERRALVSSTEFAKSLGFARETCPELLGFHMVFGKSVGQISLNAVANLGYAGVLFPRPVYPGDTVRAESEVIGVRETSGGKAGIVWVTTRGLNQKDEEVLRFHRWVMVHKRDPGAVAPAAVEPDLPDHVPVAELPVPAALNLQRFADLEWATGGRAWFEDYAVGERIHHIDGMTIDEVNHTAATRMYQNTARVHFNHHQMQASRFGKRLIYGGHVISVAHALAVNGLENVVWMAAWNGGVHANPTFAGDTLYAFTDVLAAEPLPGRDDLGALRLRLVAVKNADPSRPGRSGECDDVPIQVTDAAGKLGYDPRVVLDLDWWGLVPPEDVMRSRIGSLLLGVSLLVAAGVLALPAAATPGENLKVLPAGMDKKDIKPIMKGWARALGVECDHCHSDDGAAIDTEKKEIARTMFKMVQAANSKYLKKLETKITCKTCHQGDVKPKK